MPLVAPPIDYDAIRVALVSAVRRATGLVANKVIMAEPEIASQPRPALPYVTIKFTQLDQGRSFPDTWVTDDYEDCASQQSSVTASIQSYATTHEAAYGMISSVKAAFRMPPVQLIFARAKLAVWDFGPALDVSALMDAGYEGRAAMDVALGVASNARFTDAETIEFVPIESFPDDADRFIVHAHLGAP